MLLFLSGGGKSKNSIEIDKRFLDSLPNKKFVYIPIALEGNKKYPYDKCYEWINNTFSVLASKQIEITMLTDLNNVEPDFLNPFDGIYIGGGNTYKLMEKMLKTNFIKLLLDFIKKDKSVYGGSAGAIILGKSIATANEENLQKSSSDNGLNLLKDFSIRCHYSNSKVEIDLINNFNKGNGGVFALSEQTGLIVSDNSIEAVGKKPVYIFTDSKLSFDRKIGKFVQIKNL